MIAIKKKKIINILSLYLQSQIIKKKLRFVKKINQNSKLARHVSENIFYKLYLYFDILFKRNMFMT